MSSKSKAAVDSRTKRPSKSSLPAEAVQDFRKLLKVALRTKDETGSTIGSSKWGIYAFYDYDGEPIYVGQTKEGLATRINRHLTNQRTDAVAMRILDTFEVAEMEMWPLWELKDEPTKGDKKNEEKQERFRTAQATLDASEYSAYLQAIDKSKFGAILNEKIPPLSEPIALPPSHRFPLITEKTREDRGHADVRIARRAETISRLAAVAHERGEVSDGLRRVLVIQAVRLAYISAVRLAFVEGREAPDPDAISVDGLVGSVLYEHSDPHGAKREDDDDGESGLEDGGEDGLSD